MIRGRRVVYMAFITGFFLFSHLSQPSANEFSMTAKVPLSPVWQKAIENRSTYNLDLRSFRNIARLNLSIKGVNDIPLSHEHIQILLFKDDILVDRQEKNTDSNGYLMFTLVYERASSYRIFILDMEHEYPFVIRNVFFST
ncbi:MAG: hypothetical protein WC489_04515 [Patescibacteria group bacterium]